MRELSLHVTDIIQNSIAAKADLIEITINENINEDKLIIIISDNGCGMDGEMVNKVSDPFVTSRNTRKIGLGISLFKSACERCDGNLEITSKLGKGTNVFASMRYSHIDRAPIGKIEDSLSIALLNENVDFIYIHRVNEKEFTFDSREIKSIVGNDLNNPEIITWIKEYIKENIENIGGGKW